MSDDDGLERLRLLASAIAARPLEVAAVEPGALPWTDGTTVFVDATATHAEQVQALAVQASLLATGSLEPALVTKLSRRRSVARRYLAVEGHRSLASNETYLPWSVRSAIDRTVTASVDSASASLAVALGREPVADPPPSFGTIRPRQLMASIERAEAASRVGRRADQAVSVSALRELDDDEDADPNDPRYLGNLLSSPVGQGGRVGRLFQKLFGSTRHRGGGGPPGGDAATHVGRARPHGESVVVTASAAVVESTADEAGSGTTYPEWNVRKHSYRPDWCTVVEDDARLDADQPLVMPDGLALRRPLGRLGMGLVRCRRQPQGDDIDIDAAVEARVEVLAGSPPDDAFYVESLRRRRDLSVLVLLDVSGSASEPGPTGRPVHELQREAAAALTTALHDLGDRVALYAFNSQGRSSVRVMRVKSFDDGLDHRVAQRLGGLVPAAYTRLGAAIRHGSSIVEEHGGTSRRLLVVLSDGFAYDHGYEGRYGEADARRALAEARRRGVGCLCLSVGAGVDADALRRVFGTAAHAAVRTPDELPRLIGPLFLAALRSAEAQRRVFQRKERTRERLEIERGAA